jgi:hypothetical protein
MLQNRVDPSGTFITTTARGCWMGNRGVIHKGKEIVRIFKHKAWITCALEFKGRKRQVMTPDRWTELFFLDEATAFAAGHRPCFECRKEDARKFKACWIAGNPQYNFSLRTSIGRIDEVIHRERIDGKKKKIVHQRASADIAEGTFVLINGHPYVVSSGGLQRWTPFGYENSIVMPDAKSFVVLTPNSIVNTFRAGYVPQLCTNMVVI